MLETSHLFVLYFFSLHESLLLQNYSPLFSDLCFLSFLIFPVLSVFLQASQTSLSSFFFLSPFFSFSLGAKPLETPRIFPHAFSSHSTESFYPDFSKSPSFFSSKCLIFSSFFQTSILSIRTTPFSFIFSSGIPHLQPWNPNSFSSHLPKVGSCPL